MKDKRQGNDLKVAWSIFMQDGEPFRLDGKDVSLYLKNMFGRKELNDFVTTGNIIQWTFYGKDQKNSGKYSLEMVINEGEKGMITTDKCDFVNLVSCSCKVQNSEDAPNVETESIELTSTLEYVSGGGDYDDTALWRALDDKVDKVNGKGLSSNDYTDEDKAKLAGLKNYDDSVIKGELAKKIESEVVVDTEPTEDFEFGYDDTGIRQEIAELSAEVSGLSERIDNLPSAESSVFEAVYNTTAFAEIVEAYNAGKSVTCRYGQTIAQLISITDSVIYFTSIDIKSETRFICYSSNRWAYNAHNTAHELTALDNGNVQVTIAGNTAEVATPQYVENLLGTLINGDY